MMRRLPAGAYPELRGRGLDRIDAGIPIANENGRANVFVGDC